MPAIPIMMGSVKQVDFLGKITRAKWDGDKAQEVEDLPSKCEALRSNDSTARKMT
jgi:hypothetical protein